MGRARKGKREEGVYSANTQSVLVYRQVLEKKGGRRKGGTLSHNQDEFKGVIRYHTITERVW